MLYLLRRTRTSIVGAIRLQSMYNFLHIVCKFTGHQYPVSPLILSCLLHHQITPLSQSSYLLISLTLGLSDPRSRYPNKDIVRVTGLLFRY